ncbi:amino acid ABC transporter permease [Microbacterium sediminis]|uniref:ABC transporter permease n=1 Tax=Microbacterium sediminis TaxID=904291 RepID=A0A1B9NG63_9MICO|nr:amino acid ABC transporter permease [Microbacterium sediminis]OCG75597.1 ABC transporter permease [Microbacterium sediminis]QBR73994.1 amino acid ABC transporter permease [Microbacterium sediminis]
MAQRTITTVPVRHYGRWITGAVVLALLGAVIYAFSQADIQYGQTLRFLTVDTILEGMVGTLVISVAAQALGIVLGVVAAVMRLSANPVARWVAGGYVWLFRGTPVLVQLLLWYNLSLVFPEVFGMDTNTLMTPFLAALLGLGINEGAYMAEIVRAGIGSIDQGQIEAAKAIGMRPGRTMRRIVLPQAMRVIVPPTGNEFINMLKTSSLAYSIQYGELLLSAVKIYSNNLLVVELLLTVSIWYLILTTVFSIGQYFLEQRFHYSSVSDASSVGDILKRILPGRTR